MTVASKRCKLDSTCFISTVGCVSISSRWQNRVISRALGLLSFFLPLPPLPPPPPSPPSSPISSMSTRKASSFPVIERHLLSINQQGVWFDLQTLPTSHQHAYHLALDYTYTSTSTSLDMHALKNATDHLQQCHPMLCTTFTDDSDEMETNVDPNITSIIDSLDGQPYYRVHEIDECITFYQHDMPQDKDDLIHTSFDLRHQFPIRVHVYPTSTSTSSTYIILILIHHLVADGFSLKLIHHQFWDAYKHYTSQSHDVASPSHDIPLPIPPSITYTHHVDDESTAMITESSHRKTSSSTWWSQAEQYWMNVAPTRAPYHRIPMERDVKTTTTTITPSTTSTWKDSHTPCINAHHDIHIPIEMYQHLLSYAQQHNITLFTLLSSIIYIWLYRYHGHIDVDEEVHIPIGIALNGRPRHPSHGNVIGFYSNPMPITCSLMRQHTLKDVINSVKSHLSLAKQHERYPSTQLSRRMRSSHVTNMYHVAMTSISVFQQPYQHVTCNHHLYTQQPMLIDLYGINRAHDSIRIMYNPTLFTHSTIQRMMSNLMILMQHICNDDVMSISNIPMIHHEEQNLILHTFNAHKNSAYLGQTLHGRFEKQAYETPHAMACIDPHTSITYQQLDRAATKLAMYLRERMIKRGDTTTISIPSPSPSSAHPATPIICIVVDPVISTLIGFIGIHKAGYAYVVIDSTWPSERISFVATNSHAVDIVYATTRVYDLTHTYLESVITTTPIVIDSDNYQQHVAHIDISTYVGVYDTHNLAYMLYTSGTTGVPKGVEIEHISICNTISCIQEYMCISPHDRFLQMVSMAFDPCQMEIYITLWHGASLILPDRDMMGTITKHHVTILNMVPSLLATIDPADVPSVRLVQIGGEPLPLALAHAWARRGQAINAYGPTECAVETHRQILSASQDKITIGSAITNTTTYVLDAVTHQPVPIGVVGVIFVGGPQLARGYHARDDLNTRAFIRNPWSDDSPYSHRLYNTGDMGMWHADGTISCLARVDSQIKWHGYRIELHEIESCIMTHQHVTSCCVVLHRFHTSEDVDADSCLVAYITPMDVDIDSLRTHITRSLARYMVPAIFIPMTSLPLTVNHKVDRTRLPQPQRGSTRKHSRTRSCEISKHTRTRSCEILAMDADSLPVPLSRGASHEHDISKHTSHEHETSIDDEIDLVLESGRVTPLSNRDSLTASPTFIHSRPLSRTAQARARLKTMSPIPPILKTIVSPPTPVATIRPLPTQTESSTSTLSDPIITALREVDHETIEAYVLSAWCHVLNINPHDDSPLLDSIDTTSTSLFELGGTSLTLYKLVQYYNKYMKSTYGMSQVITIVELFTHPTMEQQTNFLWGKIKILKEKLEPAPKVTPHLTPVSTPQQSRRPSTITAPTTSTSTSSETCPIAIVGMSGRISSAQDLNAFWAALESGTSLIHQLSDDELGHLNAKQLSNPDFRRSFGRMSDIDRFDADFFKISHREAVLLDPQQRILLEQCVHALHDACIDPDVIAKANNGNSNSIGVFVAASESTYATHNLDHIQRGAVTAQDSQQQYQLAIANHMDTMATRIAYKLNCTGPAVALTTACSSSLSALVMACRSIDAHDCGTALVGGVSIPCPQSGYVYQDGMIMSNSGVCRPFDAQADGTVLGSAAVTIVIKRLTDAQRDGNPIYAVIKAASINNDGSSKMGYTTPSVQGQSACISHALSQAHIDPHHMDYIEAHGTATKIGDPCEVQALTQAFKQATTQEMKYQYCALGSVKSNVGHTDTAAGLVGLIKCVLAMKNKVIPPTVNFTTSNPSIDFAHSPFYINNKAIPWQSPHHIRTCGVSSFGIGGTNTHVILQEHIQPNIEMIPISHHLFILSAPTVSTLIRMLSQWITYLTSTSITSQQFQSICYTLAHGRRAYAMRVTCVVQHVDELISMLQQQKSIAEQQSPSGSATPATNTPTRMASRRTSVSISIPTSPTSTSTGPTNLEAALQHQNHANIQLSITSNMSQGAQLVLLFPGQGTFDIIRAREMYLSNSLYRHHFHHAATLVDEITTSTYPEMWMIRVLLSDAPIATTTRTSMIQLFLFIHEYTMSQLLLSCMDITPYAVMGHSLGEYVAACVAGYLSLKDALYLVHTRQLLMNTLPSGSMLAMNIPPSEAYTHVNASISLAAINSSSQAVYSGLTTDIQALAATCASKGIQHKLLGLAAPMHSHLIEQILPAFHTACTRITSSTPTIRMISNVTGDWIPADGILDASYWCEHMRHTVKFYHGVDTLIHTSTSRLVMVEVGHGRTLTNMMTSSFPSITPRAVEAVSTPIDPSIPWYRRSRISPTSHACQFRCIVMSPTLVDATRSYAETWAQLWHNHISITWKSVYQQVHPITVPSTSEVTALTAIPIPSTTSHHIIPLISGLPSYPFDHQHSFWMEPPHHVRRPSALALSMSKPLRIARGKNAPAAKVTRVRGTSGNRKTPSPAAAPGNKSRRGSTVRTPPAPTQRSISRGSSGASRPGATNVNVNSSGSLSAHTSPKAGSGSITPNGNASTSTSTVAWAIPLQTRASPAPRTAHAMKRSASGNIRRPATATATATAHPTMRKSSDGTPVTISRSTTEPVVHTPATTTPSLDHVNRALAVATSNRRKKPSPPQSSVASAPASPAISASRTLNLAPPPLTLTISTSPSTSPTSPTAAAAALPPLSPRSLSSPKKRGSVPTIAPTRTRPRITPAPTNRPRVRAATAATMTTPTKTAPVAPRAAAPAIRARSAAAAPSSQTLDRDAEAAADAAMDAAIEAAVAAGTPITWDAVAIERMVKRAFHHVLGFPIALMDGNTHFFERGGDSFMGIALLAFLQRKTHVTTDARMLYNAPTVKALTQLLLETHQTTLTSSSSRSSSPSTPTHTRKHHVVVLRAGNGMNPLFVAAPVGGTLYIYRDFLTTLSPHQTVYGFDYPMDMEENSIEPLTVEQLASEYIQQMLEIYPHQQCSNGYQLYGTSFGGMVCYEMLIQLHRMNVPVHLLGMLDTPRSDCFRQFFSIGNKAAILYGMFGDKYDFTLEQIEAHSKDDATLLQFAIDTGFIRQGRKGTEKITTTSTSTLSPDILGAWSALDVYVQIFERNVHSLLAYRGDPLPHDVKTAIVFLQVASPKPGDPIEPAQSWRALLAPQHDYTVKFIPGHHLSSNFQPHAIYIERALKHYMHPIITTSTSTAPSATSTSTSQHVPSHKETEHKTMEMTVTPPAAYLLPVGSSQSAPVSSHVSPLMRATSDMRTPLPLLSLTSIADVDGDVDGQSTVSTSRPPAPVVRVDSSDSDTDIVDGVAVGVGVFVGDSYPSLERDGMIQSGPSSGSRSADGEVKRTRSPVLNGRSNGKMGEIQQQNNDNEKPHHKLNCTSISHDHANIPATDQSKKSRCDRTSTSIVTST